MTMETSWTLRKKIALSFVLMVGLGGLIGGVALVQTSLLVAHHDRSVNELQELVGAAQFEALLQEQIASLRSYLLSGDPVLRANVAALGNRADRLLRELRARASDTELQRLISDVEEADREHAAVVARFEQTQRGALASAADRELLREESTKVDRLRLAVKAMRDYEERSLAEETRATNAGVALGRTVLATAIALTLLLGIVLSVLLTRKLTRELGSAIQNVRNSSTELQAAANQQATASKQQAAATNETTTTLRELAATARQIAESSQRVAEIASQTTGAAQEGDQTIQRAQEALSAIKRQVDQIVSHMLDLGRKSQQVGGILEVINELAEQTNILAINATIEAAGAGDSGRRFAVVADEIRKLADRVGGSTRDIRTLIDEVRTAVNTTVMATEQGTKAVEAGLRQVGDVASAFGRIASMVETTTEAAREIELSTKQQTTAVEQVNTAMVNVSQAARETEASASQTLATASQLATLSRDLNRLVQAGASASASADG
jgi:methyl-accepting chemotaxis protein